MEESLRDFGLNTDLGEVTDVGKYCKEQPQRSSALVKSKGQQINFAFICTH